MSSKNVLEVQNLSMVYRSEGIDRRILRDIQLEIKEGQVYGLVGESGSGKSTLGLTILGYLPPEGRVIQGRVKLASRDLLTLSKLERRSLWGREITFVPQDSVSSLNPSIRIGEQLAEVFSAHGMGSKSTATEKAVDWLFRVRLPDPSQIAQKYPHELSGGQTQRILIAMALSVRPRLVILDEPTTNLDVTTEAVILDLLQELIREEGASALFITHNLGVIAELTDRVAVLYAGEIIEDGPTIKIFRQARHPYTQGLLKSIPRLGTHKTNGVWIGIPGDHRPAKETIGRCVFTPRCQFAVKHCHVELPPDELTSEGHRVRCHRWRDIQRGEISEENTGFEISSLPVKRNEAVIQVKELAVDYEIAATGLAAGLKKKKLLKAVDRISFQLEQGHTLGIVGESGSGKSSLALAIMGLLEKVRGEVQLLNIKLPHSFRGRNREVFQRLQMVFQNTSETFPRHLKIEEILSRPLRNLQGMDKEAAKNRVFDLINLVGLPAEYGSRYPHQLSGGELQRIAIAQAFSVQPNLLIADEPVSALDVSVQANILNLLQELQREFETATILISHNISVVAYLSDEMAVMYLGQIMQQTAASRLLAPPYHPYTEALLAAVPIPNPEHRKPVIRLEGEILSPTDRPRGCPFHTRCPRRIDNLCAEFVPPWQNTQDGGGIYCHIPIAKLMETQKKLFKNHEGGN